MKRLLKKIKETEELLKNEGNGEIEKNYLLGKLQGLRLAQAIFSESK